MTLWTMAPAIFPENTRHRTIFPRGDIIGLSRSRAPSPISRKKRRLFRASRGGVQLSTERNIFYLSGSLACKKRVSFADGMMMEMPGIKRRKIYRRVEFDYRIYRNAERGGDGCERISRGNFIDNARCQCFTVACWSRAGLGLHTCSGSLIAALP